MEKDATERRQVAAWGEAVARASGPARGVAVWEAPRPRALRAIAFAPNAVQKPPTREEPPVPGAVAKSADRPWSGLEKSEKKVNFALPDSVRTYLKGKTCREYRQTMKNPNQSEFSFVYGPVPSSRLGRSLGIDLVPFKTCTYDCIYCQLGRTTNKTLERKEYVAVPEILNELKQKLAGDDRPDYITLAGSGEPTLNSGIGNLIKGIKEITDIPVAVLTNGSLLWLDEVQEALMGADVVLPSLDAGGEFLFEYVNRPRQDLSFMRVIGGIATFTSRFPGEVWLEVLLLAGVSGISVEVKKIAVVAEHINPARIQLNTAWRPCAEEFALPLTMAQLQTLARKFHRQVEIIGGAEAAQGVTPRHEGKKDTDILALLRRRPCTLEGISRGLGMHISRTVKRMDALLASGKVDTFVSGGKIFYVVADLEKVKAIADFGRKK